jgi:ABC-2 type transport system ATP-binding protein
MEASVALKKVGKLSGEKTILADLTFGIEKGTITAIIGANDAGKSTLMNVMAGIESPNYGAVYIDGLDLKKRRMEIRKEIGYIPLEGDLESDMTIEENIQFIASLYSIDKTTIQSRLHRFCTELSLGEILDQYPGHISTGIQKKAMLLRVLVLDSAIIYLDEPTAFMDPDSAKQVWGILNRLQPEKTIVYTSQNLKEVEKNHDRILVLKEGKIVLDGNLDSLLESTIEYHQFRLELWEITDEIFKQIELISTVVTPKLNGNTIIFYGKSKSVFFQVLDLVGIQNIKDLELKKLGLDELLDSELDQKGFE